MTSPNEDGGLRVRVPLFRQPAPLDPPLQPSPTDPASPAPVATAPTVEASHRPSPLDLTAPRAPRPPQSPPTGPTGTSTPGDNPPVERPTAKEAATVIAGLVGIVMTIAAVAVRMRSRRELRQPTPGELDNMAAPLGRIASRHADKAWLNADLGDVLALGNAIGGYINAGPLTTTPTPDSGVPANLQETA